MGEVSERDFTRRTGPPPHPAQNKAPNGAQLAQASRLSPEYGAKPIRREGAVIGTSAPQPSVGGTLGGVRNARTP